VWERRQHESSCLRAVGKNFLLISFLLFASSSRPSSLARQKQARRLWFWISWQRQPCLLRKEKLFVALVSLWFGGEAKALGAKVDFSSDSGRRTSNVLPQDWPSSFRMREICRVEGEGNVGCYLCICLLAVLLMSLCLRSRLWGRVSPKAVPDQYQYQQSVHRRRRRNTPSEGEMERERDKEGQNAGQKAHRVYLCRPPRLSSFYPVSLMSP